MATTCVCLGLVQRSAKAIATSKAQRIATSRQHCPSASRAYNKGTMAAEISDRACCTGCGYRLRGLPDPLCPECGRSFDPADPTTYVADPTRRRRRLWIKRGVIALTIVVLLATFAPRRILRSTMTFNCAQCGQTLSFSRWEPRPPDWIPFRYPGWRRDSQSPSSTPAATCPAHRYSVKGQFDMYSGGVFSGRGPIPNPHGEVTTFNRISATPSSAHRILTALMAPDSSL